MNDENKIYWFNGKRFEFWCEANANDILYIENDIYTFKQGSIYKWQQKQFTRISNIFYDNAILACFRDQHRNFFICLQDSSVLHFESHRLIHRKYGQTTILHSRKIQGNSNRFVKFKQFVYVFEEWSIHKFDLNEKQWFDIYVETDMKSDIVQINEILYFFDSEMKCKRIFDLVSEEWQTIQKIQIHK